MTVVDGLAHHRSAIGCWLFCVQDGEEVIDWYRLVVGQAGGGAGRAARRWNAHSSA